MISYQTSYYTGYFLIDFAGTPLTISPAGTSLITTLFGAIMTLSPTLTFPITFEPIQQVTLSPIIGRLSLDHLFPRTQPAEIVKLLPTFIALIIPPPQLGVVYIYLAPQHSKAKRHYILIAFSCTRKKTNKILLVKMGYVYHMYCNKTLFYATSLIVG